MPRLAPTRKQPPCLGYTRCARDSGPPIGEIPNYSVQEAGAASAATWSARTVVVRWENASKRIRFHSKVEDRCAATRVGFAVTALPNRVERKGRLL